jgi:hypothetical protein
MLTTEEIRARLEAAKTVKPWVQTRTKRLSGLDQNLRAVGNLLLGCNETGEPASHERGWARRSKGVERLAKLKEAELIKLGETLFADYADVFRAAWDLHVRLPVQYGYTRKPFRAPSRPELLLARRRAFLATLVDALEGYGQDLEWIAAHAAHISPYGGSRVIGTLLAGAIEVGGPRGA